LEYESLLQATTFVETISEVDEPSEHSPEDTPVVDRTQVKIFDELAERLAEETTLHVPQTTEMSATVTQTIARTSAEGGGSSTLEGLQEKGIPEEGGPQTKESNLKKPPDRGEPSEQRGPPGGPPGPPGPVGAWDHYAAPNRVDYGGTGGWAGSVPFIFDGDRKKTKEFWRKAMLYMGLNRHMRIMKNPSQRALWVLSYIQGPRVKAWLNAEVLKLKNMVDKLHFTDDDEEIWDTFESDFKHTFEDESQKADGMLRLQNLSMASEKGLEEYISTFDTILAEIGWSETNQGPWRLFKDGLDMWISRRMHLQDTWPDEDNLDGWEKAARKAALRAKQMKTRDRQRLP